MFVVINQLHIPGDIEDILAVIRDEFSSVFNGLPGFKSFDLVKTDADRYTVLIFWETGEDAARGAGIIGPSLFAKHIGPRLASEQQRTMGPVVASVRGNG